eukprot:m.225627 g.225627  ORF g.225627 m.225627 type:complete len:52 (-) comp15959_c1_seq6:293-448(-)
MHDGRRQILLYTCETAASSCITIDAEFFRAIFLFVLDFSLKSVCLQFKQGQ